MQSATFYLFSFRNESDLSIDFGLWNWVKNGPFFFELESLPYSICFSCMNSNFFSIFFFNFLFCNIPLRLGRKAIIVQLCRVGSTNRASHIKGKNQESSGKVWRAITPGNLHSLYKSMPRKMAAVIAEGEGHTKYWCTIIVDIFINISKEIHLLIGCRVFFGLDSRWRLQAKKKIIALSHCFPCFPMKCLHVCLHY